MTPEIRRYFFDALRTARAASLGDGEAFDAIVVVVEQLGALLKFKPSTGLQSIEPELHGIAEKSALAQIIPAAWPFLHRDWTRLFGFCLQARNEAIHQGARARHLSSYWVQLSLILEDALMQEARTASEFMVSRPLEALPWQPVSYVRQAMLANGFSYVPVRIDGEWLLLSDLAVARYLDRKDSARRRECLGTKLEDAVRSGNLILISARTCSGETPTTELLAEATGVPVLVVDGSNLVGIITPFDLL